MPSSWPLHPLKDEMDDPRSHGRRGRSGKAIKGNPPSVSDTRVIDASCDILQFDSS